MQGPRGVNAGRWMVAWGLLDLAYFAHYVVDSIGRGMTPLLGDLAAARDTAAVHGNAVPVWVAAASLLVYVSLPVSGVLLLQRRPAGAWLAAVQALPRLLLAVPTGAILLWPGGWATKLPGGAAVAIAIAVLLAAELFKLATLFLPRFRRGP